MSYSIGKYATKEEIMSFLNSYNENKNCEYQFESPSNGHAGKFPAEIYCHGGVPEKLVEDLTYKAKLTFSNVLGSFTPNTDCTLNKLISDSKKPAPQILFKTEAAVKTFRKFVWEQQNSDQYDYHRSIKPKKVSDMKRSNDCNPWNFVTNLVSGIFSCACKPSKKNTN